MRVLISQGGLSTPPNTTTLCHCSVSVLVSVVFTGLAAGVGLFAECPPAPPPPPPPSKTTEASSAGLIRLIPMPVMIARHIFLMTSGYQRALKRASSKARSRPPQQAGGATAYCESVSTLPLCALCVPTGQAGTCVQLGLARKIKGGEKKSR